MKIFLGNALIWGHDEILDKDKNPFTLTKSTPGPIEIDFDNLDPRLQGVVNTSLAMGDILDLEMKNINPADIAAGLQRELELLFNKGINEFKSALNILVRKKRTSMLERLLEKEKNERKDKERLELLMKALVSLSKDPLGELYFSKIFAEKDQYMTKEEFEKFVASNEVKENDVKNTQPPVVHAGTGNSRRSKGRDSSPDISGQ